MALPQPTRRRTTHNDKVDELLTKGTVFNASDWSTEYLGTMFSSGTALSCSWKSDWVGEWNLGSVDRIRVANYSGGAGKPNLVIHNKNWLGLMKTSPSPTLERLYYRWVHNYRHGRNW